MTWTLYEIDIWLPINKVLLEHNHTHLFICSLWLSLHYNGSWIVETFWLQSLKYLLSGPLKKKFANLSPVWSGPWLPPLCPWSSSLSHSSYSSPPTTLASLLFLYLTRHSLPGRTALSIDICMTNFLTTSDLCSGVTFSMRTDHLFKIASPLYSTCAVTSSLSIPSNMLFNLYIFTFTRFGCFPLSELEPQGQDFSLLFTDIS